MEFDVDTQVPGAWEVILPKNNGRGNEKTVLREMLAAGRTYGTDRGYRVFTILKDQPLTGVTRTA
jgi:hypothetical protein